MPVRSRDTTTILQAISGSPQFLGVITTTGAGAINNNGTAVPFYNTAGSGLGAKMLLIQPDAACSILPVSAVGTAVTAANGVTLVAAERVVITMQPGEDWLSVIRSSGNVGCRVWELV